MPNDGSRCAWVSLADALTAFVHAENGTQSAEHIMPLHWYVACRLVIEGGFNPDDVTPHPPFRVSGGSSTASIKVLHFDPTLGGFGERTILGGVKTKDVDVVVTRDGIGPCVAVSMKGMLNAFRNLTNRMEEAVGDCTNLHIAYPTLVYAFLHVLRATKEGPLPQDAAHFLKPDDKGNVKAADVAIRASGEVSDGIARYHDAMARLTGRRDVRNDVSRYEAIALVLANADSGSSGNIFDGYPFPDSPLLFGDFFDRIYRQYDQRFVYAAPALAKTTRRFEWDPDSPAFRGNLNREFKPRLG